MVSDLMENQSNPTIAPYAKTGEVHFRITARAAGSKEAQKLIAPVAEELKNRFGSHIYTMEEDVTLEKAVADLLAERNWTIATAESCTGGLLAARLVNVPGVSEVFHAGFITYADEAKQNLIGVKEETLKQYGAVSGKTAEEMAVGAAKAAGADAAVSITGIAGPDGGTKDKPVGLVYIGCYVDGKVRVEEYHFTGSRLKIRESVVAAALVLLRNSIIAQ